MSVITRQRQATRLETFVDAAFAFALTMLVVSVDSVPQSFDELVEAIKRVPAFAASFLITVMFWLGHYRWSRRYGIEDTGSVVLSLALVLLVLVFLYPLRIMMSGALQSMSGGFLPGEIAVGLGWDRAAVTLRADYYVLRSAEGVVARGRNADISLSEGEGGWVVLTSW